MGNLSIQTKKLIGKTQGFVIDLSKSLGYTDGNSYDWTSRSFWTPKRARDSASRVATYD